METLISEVLTKIKPTDPLRLVKDTEHRKRNQGYHTTRVVVC